jgi:hypothetical protein
VPVQRQNGFRSNQTVPSLHTKGSLRRSSDGTAPQALRSLLLGTTASHGCGHLETIQEDKEEVIEGALVIWSRGSEQTAKVVNSTADYDRTCIPQQSSACMLRIVVGKCWIHNFW